MFVRIKKGKKWKIYVIRQAYIFVIIVKMGKLEKANSGTER